MIKDLIFNISKRKRKTTSIYIERDGTISVYAPESMNDNEIQSVILSRQYQIHKYLAKKELLNENKASREPVNGQSYPYLGRNYYLQYSPDTKTLKLKGKYFIAPETKNGQLQELFRDFYRKRGASFITPKAHDYAEKIGVPLEEVSILELKNRWASCSINRAKVNFHWKTMMAPVSVIEYLIVHELAHFKYSKHDSQFWNEVDKVIPNYQEKVDWLKRYGASLTI
jgi:predicted metal-dependent hydrolase